MKSSAELFSAVQNEFDASRDPMDHAGIVARLLEHPEDLEAFADLRVVAARLEAAPLRRGRLFTLLVAAAAVLLIFMVPRWLSSEEPTQQTMPPFAQQATSPFAQQPSAPPTAHKAVLLMHNSKHERQLNVGQFASTNPDSGAVVLSMKSSVHHSRPQ